MLYTGWGKIVNHDKFNKSYGAEYSFGAVLNNNIMEIYLWRESGVVYKIKAVG